MLNFVDCVTEFDGIEINAGEFFDEHPELGFWNMEISKVFENENRYSIYWEPYYYVFEEGDKKERYEYKDIEVSKITEQSNLCESDVDTIDETIIKDGLSHPIILNGDLEILYGEEYFLACKKIGYHTVPCIIITEEN